jgi:hypothetical protein
LFSSFGYLICIFNVSNLFQIFYTQQNLDYCIHNINMQRGISNSYHASKDYARREAGENPSFTQPHLDSPIILLGNPQLVSNVFAIHIIHSR